MRRIEAIERDLFWQRDCRDNALNQAQRERCSARVLKLEAELIAALAMAAAPPLSRRRNTPVYMVLSRLPEQVARLANKARGT